MRFDVTIGGDRRMPRPQAGTPFRILVLGDLDGRTSRQVTQPLADRHPTLVDLDSFEPFLDRLGAAVQLGLPGTTAPQHLAVAGIDDLHPDRILHRMEQFATLRTTRELLLNPSTFELAAAQVRSWSAPPPTMASPATGGGAPAANGPAGHESDAATIERLLGRAPATPSAPSGAAAELIRRVVAPHIVSAPAGDQPALVAAVDAAIAGLMRAVLQDPGFRELEATWRGIDFLLRRLETGESLTVSLLNLSRAEFAADLRGEADLRRSALYRILVESTVQSPGAEPWALVLGLYPFGPNPDDCELLGRAARLAQLAGAPFIASADRPFRQLALPDPRPAGAFAQSWSALRALPEAACLGLSCPRMLLRLPYGRSTDPVATFAFEELTDPRDPAGYLWGHPALAVGAVLGEMYVESGWEMSPGAGPDLGELPAHLWKEGAESRLTPCAEEWLTDAQAAQLLDLGLMPWQSIRGRDAIRLARVQSIRQPLSPLAGRWEPGGSG